MRGGGSPIPKSICQNSYQKVNIFVKTKNAPNDLKCKINHIFFWKTRVPKRGEGGIFCGSPIPKSKIDQKVNIFVKTKNAPKGLKCKINQTFFFENTGSQKGGRGGVRHLGKIPKKSRFFLWAASLRDL